jgi:hypothetical protein
MFDFSPILVSIVFAWLSLRALRPKKGVRSNLSIFQASIFGLLSIQWLYYFGYFLLIPDNFPATKDERELFGGVIIPILTVVPLFFSLVVIALNKSSE